MATVIDLGAARRQQQIQQMQLMQQFMLHSPLYGTGESNLDRVLREQDEQDQKDRTQARLETESDARIRESQARQALAEKTSALKEWEAGQKDVRMYEKGQREEEIKRATIPKLEAETGYAQAGTRLREGQLAGEEEKRKATIAWEMNQQDEALKKNAREVQAQGIAQALQNNPEIFKKDNADRYEAAGKVLFGPNYRIPRDDQGNWKPDMENLAKGATNDKGELTGELAKNLHEADKPKTDFEAIVKAAQEAEAKGNTQAAKWYGSKLYEMYAPTLGKVQGELIKGMLDDGRVNDANDMINQWRSSSSTKVQMPDPTARHDTEDMMSTLGSIHQMRNQFQALVNGGTIPVGSPVRMKMYDLLNAAEHSNPDVQAFRANIQDTVALYRKFITGKQSNDKEMADLLKAVPNETDDVKSFTKKLAEMQWKTVRKIRSNLGVQQAYGIKTPDLGPGFEPIPPSEAMKKWGTPDLRYEHGQLVSGALNMERGKQVVADQLRRSGQSIGGVNEFRGQGGGPSGGDVSKYPPGMDPSLYSLFDQMAPEDRAAVMAGREPGSEGAGARE